MPGYLNVIIVGDTLGVQAMLMRMNSALSPPELGAFLSTVVVPWLRQRAGERFRQEGDDVSGKWLPLSQYTQNVRSSQGYGAAHPINRRSARLENYITQSPSRVTMHAAGANLVYPGNPPTGELEQKVRTAQIGRPFPNTQPRPVLGVNERDLAAVLSGLALHIKGTP